MSTALYRALKSVGVDDALAQEAAQSVIGTDRETLLATKQDIADLKIAMADLQATLIKWNVGALAFLTVIYAAIAAALRFVRP
jgi:hypothetical protein